MRQRRNQDKLNGEYLNDLRFTNEIVFPSDSEENKNNDRGTTQIQKVGQKMNMKKTKVILNQLARQEMVIESEILERAEKNAFQEQLV